MADKKAALFAHETKVIKAVVVSSGGKISTYPVIGWESRHELYVSEIRYSAVILFPGGPCAMPNKALSRHGVIGFMTQDEKVEDFHSRAIDYCRDVLGESPLELLGSQAE